MILALFLIGFLALLALCALSAHNWRRKAAQNAQEAIGLGMYASKLEGKLEESQQQNVRLLELAREAVRESARAAKLEPDSVLPPTSIPTPSYIAPEVKFCKCNVSIRSDKWPQPCPACSQMVGDILDADLLE